MKYKIDFSWKQVFVFSCAFHLLLLAVFLFSPKAKPVQPIVDVHLLPPMEMIPVPQTVPEPVAAKKEVLPEQKVEPIKKDIFQIKPKKEKKPIPKKQEKKVEVRNVRQQLETKLKNIETQMDKEYQEKQVDLSGVRTTQYFPYRWYLLGLQSKITQAWKVPSYFLEMPQAVVVFTLSREGKLLRVALQTSSGKPLFDQSVVEAVQLAAPFPPMPEEYKETQLEVAIQFQATK